MGLDVRGLSLTVAHILVSIEIGSDAKGMILHGDMEKTKENIIKRCGGLSVRNVKLVQERTVATKTAAAIGATEDVSTRSTVGMIISVIRWNVIGVMVDR
jgi:hypothetical protein